VPTKHELNYVGAVTALIGSHAGMFIGMVALFDAARKIARGAPAAATLDDMAWPFIYMGFMLSAVCVGYLGLTIGKIICHLDSCHLDTLPHDER